MSDKPREFWLNRGAFTYVVMDNNFPAFPGAKQIHVIEHKAYEQLKKENSIMKQALIETIDEIKRGYSFVGVTAREALNKIKDVE